MSNPGDTERIHQWLLMKMYIGEIATTSQMTDSEAAANNAALIEKRSQFRWVTSLKMLGDFEEQEAG